MTLPPSIPRLRIEPTGSRRTFLDGGWWPRSTDPLAELPGLVRVQSAEEAWETEGGHLARSGLSGAG